MSGPGIPVAKMSGAGNDFVVIDGPVADSLGAGLSEWVRLVCRRGLSIGADGALVIRRQGPDRIDVAFYNPDGGRAFCGNGSRCAARFAHDRGLAGAAMTLSTDTGDVPAVVDGAIVRLDLPAPLDRGAIDVELDGRVRPGRWIDAGVPHLVLFVDDPAAAPLERWAPPVRRDPRFGAAGVNVNLVGGESPLQLRTWERGVEAETLACGSGAVAAAFAARLRGAGERVTLLPASGDRLVVELPGPADRPSGARLIGGTRWVFEGTLCPEALAAADG